MNIKNNLEKLGLSEHFATLDIESLDTEVSMVIASIGCVVKSLLTGKVKATYYVRINLDQPGRTTSQSTLDFWEAEKQNSLFAYNEVFDKSLERLSLSDALNGLNEFLLSNMDERPKIMGNGNEFDNSAIKHAMNSLNIKPVWDHGCDQNLRTAVLLGRILLGIDPKYDLPLQGNKHHALDDAQHESEYFYQIIKAFDKKLAD